MGAPQFQKISSKNCKCYSLCNGKRECLRENHCVIGPHQIISGREDVIEVRVQSMRDILYVVSSIVMLLSVLFLLIHANSSIRELNLQTSAIAVLKLEILDLVSKVDKMEGHLNSASLVRNIAVENAEVAKSQIGVTDILTSTKNITVPHKPVLGPLRYKRSSTEGPQNSVGKSSPSSQRKAHVGPHSSKGFQAIHLKGAHPETLVEAGRVGPWFLDSNAVVDNKFSAFRLREDGESVEIKDSGIYLIYAQVYYLTTHPFNSFSIVIIPKNSDTNIPIALCSAIANSGSSTSEVSCYTATLRALQVGDRIFIQQREKNRRMIMRSGYSFLGFVKLSSID